MLPPPGVAFLSLSQARSPELHHAINSWHQLDHRPENLALNGVAHGERFVHPPAAAARAHATDAFADFHYANLYWFDSPVTSSIEEWAALAEQTLREGRRPDVDLVNRAYMDFFRLAGTAVRPGLRLNPRALVHRPCTGLLMWVTAFPGNLDRAELQHHHAHQLDHVLPALARVPGVATAWALESDSSLAPALWAAREAASGTDAGETVRLVLAATEVEDPDVVLDRVRGQADADPAQQVPAPADLRFAGALHTITPWQWDWFTPAHPLEGSP